ncbi:MAG: penicillin-binding protein 2 [Holophaga sp.]
MFSSFSLPLRLLGRYDPRNLLEARLPWVLGGMLGWVLMILLRLVWLQVVEHRYYRERAERQHTTVVPIAPIRGELRDRHGESLAISLKAESLFATPPSFYPDYRAGKSHFVSRIPAGDTEKGEAERFWGEPDRESSGKVADELARILDLSRSSVLDKLLRHKPFVWIDRELPMDKAEAVKALKLDGVDFLPESKRYYPRGSLACQVVGFVNIDGVGQLGIERAYNEQLAGQQGELVAPRDAKGHLLMLEENYTKIPVNGSTLQLTLDASIQHLVEDALAEGVAKVHPASAYAVVVDPFTGEILAMAGTPSYDPNQILPAKFLNRPESEWSPEDKAEYQQEMERQKAARRVHPVEDSYEPGSTMKIFTVASALEERKVHLGEQINCEGGHWYRNGARITDDHHFGVLSMEEVLWHSSNIGAAKIGTRLDPAVHYQYLRKFGFGEPTGLNFPGETQGHHPADHVLRLRTVGDAPADPHGRLRPGQRRAADAALPGAEGLRRPGRAAGGVQAQGAPASDQRGDLGPDEGDPQGGRHQRHRAAGPDGWRGGGLRQDRHGPEADRRQVRSQAPLRLVHGLLPGGAARVRDALHAGRPRGRRAGRGHGGGAAVQGGGRRHHALPAHPAHPRPQRRPQAQLAGLAGGRRGQDRGAGGARQGARSGGPQPQGRHPAGGAGRRGAAHRRPGAGGPAPGPGGGPGSRPGRAAPGQQGGDPAAGDRDAAGTGAVASGPGRASAPGGQGCRGRGAAGRPGISGRRTAARAVPGTEGEGGTDRRLGPRILGTNGYRLALRLREG